MKKLLYLSLAALMVLVAVSCTKDSTRKNIPVPKAIDLGITVDGHKVLFASFNLGASKEYEAGNYYAWGETEPKKRYDWSTYKYANGDYHKLTKYCPKDRENDFWDLAAKPSGADGKMQLDAEDDVAQVKLGGKWRMPTGKDINALLALKDNSNYTWEPWFEMKDAAGKSVHGLKVTQKSTGKYVFFPAAGQYYENTLYDPADADSGYWSSTLYDGSCALFLFIEPYDPSDDGDTIGRDDYDRFRGFCIRPVMDE